MYWIYFFFLTNSQIGMEIFFSCFFKKCRWINGFSAKTNFIDVNFQKEKESEHNNFLNPTTLIR